MKGAELKVKNSGITSIQDDDITDNVDSFYVLRIPGQFAVVVKTLFLRGKSTKKKRFESLKCPILARDQHYNRFSINEKEMELIGIELTFWKVKY